MTEQSETTDGWSWSRLVNPEPSELAAVQERFDLHPIVMADLEERRRHPKLERFGDCLYLTVWDVDSESDGHAKTDTELALLFTDRELLIIQWGPAAQLRDLDALLSAHGPVPVTSPISAVYRVLDAVVRDFADLAAQVERELDDVEAEVFDSEVHEDYRRIYRLRQRIGRIDRAITGLVEALETGRREFEDAIAAEPELRPYFIHLAHDADGVNRLATAEHAALDAAVSSHESNVSARQNKDMRTISAFAALLAIPTVIAGVFGMNFKNLPPTQWEYGWIVISVAIVALDLVAYFMFRRRGWLGKAPNERGAGRDS
ncbi:hypothetical protein ASC66_09020 [Leifsonia sp. Root4]|uniref:CorA family divalent cation transporter n=1 Tax=Leifsonia sp. Root4 TaxID=1736525 RepID=UPI0007021513|nr:CorA family divalent cation transporter [Leifsonia sp. Root4]KQW06594.1 hypothetical protein ASC66_09020 [Leifsonia sp. Root4]